jgi:hypothetical protein
MPHIKAEGWEPGPPAGGVEIRAEEVVAEDPEAEEAAAAKGESGSSQNSTPR